MAYLLSLSRMQWVWLVGTLTVCVAIVAFGWISEPTAGAIATSEVTTAMSIRDIAPKLDVTGKALARELGLPLHVPKGKPLEKLGVAQSDLDHVAGKGVRLEICTLLLTLGFSCRLGTAVSP